MLDSVSLWRIHAMKCEFYQVALVGVKEHLDKYTQGQLLEREA